MNRIILWVLQTEIGRRTEIQILMNLVTSALRLPGRNLLFMSSGKALDAFAAFTAKNLERCEEEQRQRLSEKAFRLGTKLRLCLSNRSDEALTKMTFLLYRNIGIDMQGLFPGKVTVPQCHFSSCYSPQICRIASVMDAGVICGLFGKGKLEFSERITEGNAHCICKLVIPTNNISQISNLR